MKHSTLLLLSWILSLAVVAQNDKPLLTIGCISDIHTERSLIDCANLDDISLRGSFSMIVDRMRRDEKIDVLLMGGDYTSDVTIPLANWQRTRSIIVDEARRAFPAGSTETPVIYVAGNHDYEVANFDNIPKQYNAGDFYSYPMREDVGELADDECFYEVAENGDLPEQRLLAAYHYELKGFHFVVLNTAKYFFKNAWNYKYSIESVQWVASKLEQICRGDNSKTIIFGIHVPFADSNSLSSPSKGMVDDDAAHLLKQTLAQYPNLIMLYGHDHGKDTSYSREKSSQRITLYDVNGQVIPTTDETHVDADPLGVNPVVTAPLQCHLLNVQTGKYLSWDSNNLCASTSATKVSFIPGSSTFQLHFDEDGNGESLHIGSNGYWSKGAASNLYVYRVTQAEAGRIMRGERVDAVQLEEQYVIVSEKDGNYYALSNSLYNGGSSSQRMTRVQVSLSSDRKQFSLTRTDESIIWQPMPTQQSGHVVSIVSQANGQYLGYNEYNLATQSTPNSCRIIPADASAGVFSLYVNGSASGTSGNYIYSSTEGRFSANGSQMPTYFYRVVSNRENQITAVLSRTPWQLGQYVIVSQNAKDNTAYYALTSDPYSSGSNHRMIGLRVAAAPADTIRIAATKKSALWNVSEPAAEEHGQPSFFSAFMGSARYYYNTIDPGDMPIETPNIVQAMMVYIYSDRVEMHMKNFNKTGTFLGITVNPYLQPYISYRKVQTKVDDDAIHAIGGAPTASAKLRYNLMGQQVNDGYSGIVIQNGSKQCVLR